MFNTNALKFGYPHTLVAETTHWWLPACPCQITLGMLTALCKQLATAFGGVSALDFADLQVGTARSEAVLKGFVHYERINFRMFMQARWVAV